MDDKYFEDVFSGATCKWRPLDFRKRQICVQRMCSWYPDRDIWGVAYHVAGVLDFDVEIDIPGNVQRLQFSDCDLSMQTF